MSYFWYWVNKEGGEISFIYRDEILYTWFQNSLCLVLCVAYKGWNNILHYFSYDELNSSCLLLIWYSRKHKNKRMALDHYLSRTCKYTRSNPPPQAPTHGWGSRSRSRLYWAAKFLTLKFHNSFYAGCKSF